MKPLPQYIDFEAFEVDSLELPDCLNHRNPESHKGDYGHALLIAGSYGRCGCAILAAKACLRAGVGLLTVHVPRNCVDLVQTAVPEAMVSIDPDDEIFTELPENIDRYTAIAAGPGLGTDKHTAKALKELLQQRQEQGKSQLVLDADALNILSENPKWMRYLPAETIFTPHVKEFERLFGNSSSPEQRLLLQRQQAMQNKIVLLHKGHRTSVCMPDGRVCFNASGNPGMATAGSGDVLTGILLALLAQGLSPVSAAVTGVYIHGKSADLAVQNQSQASLIASDIVENLRYVAQ